MTTAEIADRLVALCRTGDFAAAQHELFAEDAVSLEPHATPMFEQTTRGLPAILAKGEKFKNMTTEVHSLQVSDPVVATQSFACTMAMDITMKRGGRMEMKELCVYQVKDEKICSEQFFL